MDLERDRIAEMSRALAKGADGLILLDSRGNAGFLDETAAELLSTGDGLSASGGQLTISRLPEMRKLRYYISEMVGTSARGGGDRRYLLVPRPSGKRPYLISLLPPRTPVAQHCVGGWACVIHLYDLASPREPSRQALHEALGLTAREADLAIALVRTAHLAFAAAAAGMAVNTARNHLRGIFLKTGTSNQGEAVQLLSKMP